MVTTAFSVSGYWLTGSWNTARAPSTRISRLTTIERTGRSMNRSVNFIRRAPLMLLRGRAGRIRRLRQRADVERRAVLQLQLSAGNHLIALLDACQHRHLVAAGGTGGD